MSIREYDVALSFAGEDRAAAEETAEALRRRGVRVFYDRYEKATLWGVNLYTRLSDLYRNRAHYCVIFVSKHYAVNLWATHEHQAAQARAFEESREYVLPLRLDETPVEGILPTVGFLSWAEEGAEGVADALVEKLRALHSDPTKPKTIPLRRSSERKRAIGAVAIALALVVSVLILVSLFGPHEQDRVEGGGESARVQTPPAPGPIPPAAGGVSGALPPYSKFLTFSEGDPGVPGDGKFVNALGRESSGAHGGALYYDFLAKPALALGDARRGLSVALFLPPQVKSLEAFDNLQVNLGNLKGSGPCSLSTGGTATWQMTRVAFSSAQGISFRIPASFFEGVLRDANRREPACKYTLDDLYLVGLSLSSTKWNQTVSNLDAVAVSGEPGHATNGSANPRLADAPY